MKKIFGLILICILLPFFGFAQPFSLADTNVKVGQFQHLYDIKFQLGSSDLFIADVFQLDSVYQFLKNNSKVNVELGAHTDFRGDDNKNLELSKDRAASIKKYLVEKGISSERIKAIGFGETKPVFEYEDWKKIMDTHRCGYYGRGNRRVTIVVTSKK